MSFKNENIAIVVFVLVLVVGYSVTGWNELSEGEAAVIVPAAFVLAAATTAVLYARDDRRRDARERSHAARQPGDPTGATSSRRLRGEARPPEAGRSPGRRGPG